MLLLFNAKIKRMSLEVTENDMTLTLK